MRRDFLSLQYPPPHPTYLFEAILLRDLDWQAACNLSIKEQDYRLLKECDQKGVISELSQVMYLTC